MRCPACRTERTNEYFHVLTLVPENYPKHFNFCCSNCLAERLRVPRHIHFKFTEEDKQEIRKIVREEISRSIMEAKPD